MAKSAAVLHGKSEKQRQEELRDQLVDLLKGGQAHVHFSDALDNFPVRKRGAFAKGFPHTGWQLLEHVRIAQWDIVEFSKSETHVSPEFPDGYWPKTPVPPTERDWVKSEREFRYDLKRMITLVRDPKTDLFAAIPKGEGKTILREVLVLADHNAYHLGQLVALRKALGVWPEG